jgi:excisionase family DNA binding protein
MPQDLLSVFDIASRLNLHVKTVRNYVRDGRLKAIRIGKTYRILRSDLEAFTGHPLPPTDSEMARRRRHVEVSSVVQIDAISAEAWRRLELSLSALVQGNAKGGEPLRIESIYDRNIGRLRLIILGGANAAGAAIKFIPALLESTESGAATDR